MTTKVKFLQMIYVCYDKRLAETLIVLHLFAFTVLVSKQFVYFETQIAMNKN